jgi:hypothetical protein
MKPKILQISVKRDLGIARIEFQVSHDVFLVGKIYLLLLKYRRLSYVTHSVAGPDPYVFGPPGSKFFSQRTKVVRKTLIPTVL